MTRRRARFDGRDALRLITEPDETAARLWPGLERGRWVLRRLPLRTVRRYVVAYRRWEHGWFLPHMWNALRTPPAPTPPTTPARDPDPSGFTHTGADEAFADQLHEFREADPELPGWEAPAEALVRARGEAEAILDAVEADAAALTEQEWLVPFRARLDRHLAAVQEMFADRYAELDKKAAATVAAFGNPFGDLTQEWPLVVPVGRSLPPDSPVAVPPWRRPLSEVFPAAVADRLRWVH